MKALVAPGARTTANTSTAAPTAPRTRAGVSIHARRQTNGLCVKYQPSAWPTARIAIVTQNPCIRSGAGSPWVGTNIRVNMSQPAPSVGERKTDSVITKRANVNATRSTVPGGLRSTDRTPGNGSRTRTDSRWATSRTPWRNPHTTIGQFAPCQRPPRVIVISTLRFVRQ